MDSNVLDDNSARQSVETLLRENDVKGAIDFARRVPNSFPKLKRLLRFLANIVVQVSSEDEEIDWYTVLGVDPSADPKTIKQHYVKLAKNSTRGSYEAHRLLNKAWDTLCNKFTKKDYNLRRRLREMQPLDTFLTACPNCYNKSYRESLIRKADCLQCGTNFAGIDIPSPELTSPQPTSEEFDVSPRLVTFPSDTLYVSGLILGSSATQSIQPAPVLYNVPENNRSGLSLVSSATQFFQPAHDMYNVSGNYESGPRLASSATQLNQPAPGLFSVSGQNGSGLRSVFSATQSIQPASSGLATFFYATQSIQPERVNKKRLYEGGGGDQTSSTIVKAPCNFSESGITLPPVARSTGNKKLPENHMSPGSDGQKGVHLGQRGDSLAEKVGASGSSKGNRKKKLPDVEKNILMKKARNVILNKLNMWNAAARDNNERNPLELFQVIN